jgi:hypothetical protein
MFILKAGLSYPASATQEIGATTHKEQEEDQLNLDGVCNNVGLTSTDGRARDGA